MENDKNKDERHILRQSSRVAMLAGELSKEGIMHLENTKMPSKYDYLNKDLDEQSETTE